MLKGKKIEMMLLKREMILISENKSDYIDQFEKIFRVRPNYSSALHRC